MSYLDAWNSGFDEGQRVQLKLINEFSGTDFKAIADLVLFLREAKEVEEAINANG